MSSFVNGRNYTIVEGLWMVGLGVQVTFVKVYCSSSLREKKLVWEEIIEYRQNQIFKA